MDTGDPEGLIKVLAFTQSTAGRCLHKLPSPSPSLTAEKHTQSKGGEPAKDGRFFPAVKLRYAESENLSKHPPEQPVPAFNVLNVDF